MDKGFDWFGGGDAILQQIFNYIIDIILLVYLLFRFLFPESMG